MSCLGRSSGPPGVLGHILRLQVVAGIVPAGAVVYGLAARKQVVEAAPAHKPEQAVGPVQVLFHNSGKHNRRMLCRNWYMFALISHPIPKLDMTHKLEFIYQFFHNKL